MNIKSMVKAAASVLFSLALLGSVQIASAHGVQVAYGTTPTGFVRIYIEHWHGNLSSLVYPNNINVTVTSASGSNSFNVNPSGTVNNTAVGSLPGLVGPITVLATTSSSNTYNDWGYWDFAPGSCNQPISITVNQGNSVVFTEAQSNLYPATIAAQTFTDQAAPSITAPNVSVIGDCSGANVSYSVSVVDDCDAQPVVSYSHASGSFFPVGTTPVTVTATDNTGKTSVKVFNVTVIVGDSTPPVLTVPAPISATAEAGKCGANVTFTTSATDNCSTPTVVNTLASGAFFPVGTTTVTSVATDGSGNKTTKTFTVTIHDTEPPKITAPANLALTAGAGCTATATFAATASDNCSGVAISYAPASGSAFPVGTTVVTATATDASGNTASATFNVVVADVTAPTITVAAAGATIESNGTNAALNAWLAGSGGAAATDTCSAVTWTNNFTGLTGGCGSAGSATVVFTASDAAGNSATTTATFTVVDTTKPTITSAAAGTTVETDGAGNSAALSAWLASRGGATATDVGSAVTWSNTYAAANFANACGSTGAVSVTFTATDACNNASSTTATFTIVDTTKPAVVAAVNSTVETDGAGNVAALSAWLASNGGATATDVGSAVTWSNTYAAANFANACGSTGAVSVTFTATDACNNASSTTATFTIVDTTKPAVVAAVNSTVETDGAGNSAALSAWLASNGGATATDVGSAVTWSNNFSAIVKACGSTGAATVTFKATDACGNASTTSATFTIVDTTKPVVVAAVNKTVETDGAGNLAALSAWLASNGGATATDIGSAVTWSNNYTATSLIKACGSTGAATVTFTTTDACNNASSTTATFTIVDTTKPVLASNVRDISPNEKPMTLTITSTDVGGTSTPTITSVTAVRINPNTKTIDKTNVYKHTVSGNAITITISGGVGTIWTIESSSVDACGNIATGAFVINVVNPTLTK